MLGIHKNQNLRVTCIDCIGSSPSDTSDTRYKSGLPIGLIRMNENGLWSYPEADYRWRTNHNA
jgi:hypothetical protein